MAISTHNKLCRVLPILKAVQWHNVIPHKKQLLCCCQLEVLTDLIHDPKLVMMYSDCNETQLIAGVLCMTH